jgi:hypothetical protein
LAPQPIPKHGATEIDLKGHVWIMRDLLRAHWALSLLLLQERERSRDDEQRGR